MRVWPGRTNDMHPSSTTPSPQPKRSHLSSPGGGQNRLTISPPVLGEANPTAAVWIGVALWGEEDGGGAEWSIASVA